MKKLDNEISILFITRKPNVKVNNQYLNNQVSMDGTLMQWLDINVINGSIGYIDIKSLEDRLFKFIYLTFHY